MWQFAVTILPKLLLRVIDLLTLQNKTTLSFIKKTKIVQNLGYSSGDDTDTDFRDEFDGNAGRRIGALEVVNELGQILYRIDVVMGRRRDQSDAGNTVTGAGDFDGDFVAGQFTTFARFGALRHLDLQLVSVRKVGGRYSESTTGN